MKHTAAAIIILLLVGCAQAAEPFRIEIAHFDLQGGPLTVDEQSRVPLPDGCLVQVLLNASSSAKPFPPSVSELKQRLGEFAVNGQARLRIPGFFLCDSMITGRELPPYALFVRVWNAVDEAQATGYWNSPLYTVLPGFQQVSFQRNEWTYHPLGRGTVGPEAETASSSSGSLLAERHDLLTAYPNPFNSSARISLQVKESGRVRLRVFDLEGRLTVTPVDGLLSAGVHEIVFDGSQLPTGLYFLSLEQPAAAPVVRKLILLR
jgi:hypothetical protein